MSGFRAQKSGFARQAQATMDSKYDPEQASMCMAWINRLTGLGVDASGDRELFHEALKDGTVLCALANALQPGSVKGTVKPGKMAFTAGENYGKFFNVVTKPPIELPISETFQMVDLWEKGNLSAVQVCLQAVGRKAYKLGDDKGFGPRESQGEKREFTKEQLAAGQSVIGLQMGSNKGASQAGQNFGKSRGVNDIQ